MSDTVVNEASPPEPTPRDEPTPVEEPVAVRAGGNAMDPWLFFAAFALSALGLVMVYSASAWVGHVTHENWEYFLVRQAGFLALGIPTMLIVSRMDYRILRRFAPHLMMVALALLIFVLLVGSEVNGARRWLRFGSIGIQPSEIAKVTLTILLASTLAREGERIRSFKAGFLPIMAVAGFTMLLVQLERDLGTTILLGALTLIMLFVAGTRLSYVVAAVMLAAPIVWQQILGVEYRRGRLEAFMAGDGYQVHQALIAIGSGGGTGMGLGNGRQKLGFLPENHTDFILATVGEELGFAGIVVVLALVCLLIGRGLLAAHRATDRFGTYLAAGLSALFGLQALVNMAVVLQVIPAKGITLPFLSYGGSSLLVSLAAVGLLLAVSRNAPPWTVSDMRGRGRSRRGGRKPTETRSRNIRRAAPTPTG